MSTTIEATFDGNVFRPAKPVSLPPNTVVRITIEPVPGTPIVFAPPAGAAAEPGLHPDLIPYRDAGEAEG